VVDAEGNPVPQARTPILLTGTPEDPGDSYIETADEQGRFSYEGMTPGSYKVWAWREADEWDGDLATPRELAPRATVIEFPGRGFEIEWEDYGLNPARAGQ
jgi:hypothetical protein